MFGLLGKSIVRYWPVYLVLWIGALLIGWQWAPSWNAVSKSGEVEFLPADAPSRRADRFFRDAFPLDYSASNITLIVSRPDAPLTAADKAFVADDLGPRVRAIADTERGESIVTVRTLADERTGVLLISPDKRATLIVAELSTSLQDTANNPLVHKVENIVRGVVAEKKVPAGLEINITGSATAGRDLDVAQADSARAIEVWTIGIVIALLLLVYRAPLVALLPLVTVAVAVEISLRVLATMAEAHWITLSKDLRVFIVVLAYGAGVDYCLFLIARYEEELGEGTATRAFALAEAIRTVGGAITASAATVICGIGALAFARFAKIHEAGLIIPIALTLALLATLTFASALLRLTGRWAFWPRRRITGGGSPWMHRAWERVGALVLRHPGIIACSALLILVPFAVVAVRHYEHTNFNPLSDLPAQAPSVSGSKKLAEHFPAGIVGPITLLIEHPDIDFGSKEGTRAISQFTQRLDERSKDLDVADIRSLAHPLGTGPAAKERLAAFRARPEDVRAAMEAQAKNYYVSQTEESAGHVTRLDVTFASNPLSAEGIGALRNFEKQAASLLPEELASARLELSGATAGLRDLSDVKRADQERIQILVSVVVLLILIVVLRRLVLSVYLILTVLLSYFSTLGFTYLVFRGVIGPEFAGLDWKVPIFLFTILIAVGEDYNIFLLTRVKEEQGSHGPLGAIPVALARTGQVISTCGLVMAGTFASLLSGSLWAMKQLGVALAVGALLDTLVVRTLLVPTFLVLCQRWFPGRWGRFMALGHLESRAEKSLPVESTLTH